MTDVEDMEAMVSSFTLFWIHREKEKNCQLDVQLKLPM